MTTALVVTLIGEDRPGIVEAVSEAVARLGGNWLESRMARLAGKFAGVLLVGVPEAAAPNLQRELEALTARGLKVVVEPTAVEAPPAATSLLVLELVGQDRPGIVREISQALALRGVNVEELVTDCVSAPMSGETLFQARARLRLPPEVSVDELARAVEALGNDLMVDVSLNPPA